MAAAKQLRPELSRIFSAEQIARDLAVLCPARKAGLIDPCMGSGHFLRAAFDMFVQMYREQYPTQSMREIVDCVLSQHLFGIDLDPRAAQLTALTLYLRA